MGDRTVEEVDMALLAELLESAPEQDSLLADAIDRLKREEEGQFDAFFKHGQFGSHNS
jgi:hypothetical protein